MAKRKRLTPAQTDFLEEKRPTRSESNAARSPVPPAPIAQVAGDVSVHAALERVSSELRAVRTSGRFIEEIPLQEIDPNYLVRDRIGQDEDELSVLMNSLRTRGQQMPIEVVRLNQPVDGKVFGLISGLRRLTALNRLYGEEEDPIFATVRAVIITPETAEDAYQAMVEENEIRVNLSHYERARIALRAIEVGIFESRRAALQKLYANTTRSKRSKIGSFMAVVDALDDVLCHPAAISEKLGLALAHKLNQDAAFQDRLRARLGVEPAKEPDDEARILADALSAKKEISASTQGKPDNEGAQNDRLRAAERNSQRRSLPVEPNSHVSKQLEIRLHADRGLIEIEGTAVNSHLLEALQTWLEHHVPESADSS